jgi:membrane-bound lytic murein transglycosylase B
MKTAYLFLSLTLMTGTIAAQEAVPAERFTTCMAALRAESPAKGVSTAAFDRLTRGLTPDMSVLEFLDYQPEFRTPIWDYLG